MALLNVTMEGVARFVADVFSVVASVTYTETDEHPSCVESSRDFAQNVVVELFSELTGRQPSDEDMDVLKAVLAGLPHGQLE